MDNFCDICSTPSRDARLCDLCVAQLSTDLTDVAGWLAEEVETTLSGLKAVRPTGMPGGPGEDVGLRVDWRAADVRRELLTTLGLLVIHCQAKGTAHSSPYSADPGYHDAPGMARWLGWRVDGLGRDPQAHAVIKPLSAAVRTARRAVDRPLDREYLGACLACEHGHMYAVGDALSAGCDVCSVEYDRAELSAYVIDQLDDQLVTAAEAARLALHLGLKADRTAVHNRIRTWVTRGALHPEVPFVRHYRFGPIWRLLTRQDRGIAAALESDTLAV